MLQTFFSVIIGLGAGFLVNYLSDVLPFYRRLVKPVCLVCKKPQPVLGYLVWPRRCPQCGAKRPWRTWLVEIISVGFSIWLWYDPPDRIGYIIGMLVFVYFAVITVIDLEHRLILHPLSIVGGVLGLGLGVWLHGLVDTLIGGAAGFGIMLLFYFLGGVFARGVARLRGQGLDEVALGFGDVNLSGVIGLILGWPGILLGLLLAILLGGLFSLLYIAIMLLAKRYRSFSAIPYGPFLVASALALIFFREQILSLLGRTSF
jgi:leader peptidase (prepilin peptidase)/N-methyltransferase